MKYPPHLPPPSCSIPLHQRLRSAGVVALVALVGLISGVAGSSALLAWVWPRFVGDNWFFITSNQSSDHVSLSPKVVHDLADRIVTVFSRSESVGSMAILDPKNILGQAVIVSSDGWLMLPGKYPEAPAYAALANNKVVAVEKIAVDSVANVTYIKVQTLDRLDTQSGQFKIVAFEDQPESGDLVFINDSGAWRSAQLVARTAIARAASHLETAPVSSMIVLGGAAENSLVVMPDGRLAGFISGAGLISADAIARMVPTVLQTGEVTYPGFGIEGWYSSELPIVATSTQANSFLVTKVKTKNSRFRRGDLVLSVNDIPAAPGDWWQVLMSNAKVNVKVFRQGKIVEWSESPSAN